MRNRAELGVCALVLAISAGCYNPNIKNGGLVCNRDSSKGPACPDGFTCVEEHCVKNGSSATCPEYSAPASCGAGPAPSGMTCDPLCQTGCASSGGECQKCNLIASAGSASWTEGCTEAGTKREGDSCTRSSGTVDFESDTCGPGLTCLPNPEGSCWRCNKLCRSDADCPGSRCYWLTSTNTKTCDFAPTTCHPIVNDCPSPLSCYLLDDSNKTVCDCKGSLSAGATCATARDCLPGHVCVEQVCRKVCRLDALTGCLAGTCSAYMGSTSFGYCTQ